MRGLREQIEAVGPGLVGGLLVTTVYLLTHSQPANAGGLFLQITETISRDGLLPYRIPLYTPDGIPFGYPPLGFYIQSALQAAFHPMTLSRIFGPVLLPLIGGASGLFAATLLNDSRSGGFVGLLIAVLPSTTFRHITAGGVIRAPAFLLAVLCLWTGLLYLRSHRRRWQVLTLLGSAVLLGTHLVYALFVALSLVTLYATCDRSRPGIVGGVQIAIGAVLLTSPWWGTVMLRFGPDLYIGAAGARSWARGISSVVRFFTDVPAVLSLPVRWGMAFASVVVAYLHRDDLETMGIAVWFWVTVLLSGQYRFVGFTGAVVVGLLWRDRSSIIDWIHDTADSIDRQVISRGITGAVTVVCVFSIVTGCAFAGGIVGGGLEPAVDDDDRSAIEWVQTNTDSDSRWLVTGKVYEWFPYLSDRTIVVTPLGAEWLGDRGFSRQREAYADLFWCESPECFQSGLDRHGLRPDYLYFKTGGPRAVADRERVVTGYRASDDWKQVYSNSTVVIFERNSSG